MRGRKANPARHCGSWEQEPFFRTMEGTMDFITASENYSWDHSKPSDPTLLADLAAIAVNGLRFIDRGSQQGILSLLYELPAEHLPLEDIALCAFGQDEAAEQSEEPDEDVMDEALQILLRPDVLPLVHVPAVIALLAESNTTPISLAYCVSFLAHLPLDQMALAQIVTIGQGYGEDDDTLADAVFSYLQRHRCWDEMRQFFEPEGDEQEDTYLGSQCRKAVLLQAEVSA